MTAMTRDRGAQRRTTCKLWRSATVSTVALTIGVTGISPKYALGVRLRRVVFELGVLAQERQLEGAGRARALLGDDDVRDALARRVLVVYLFAIDQQNEVTVLFNCSTIMANNAVSQPTRRPWDRHVEDLFLTFETNGDDAVPEQIRI